MAEANISNLSEKALQRIVHSALSDPSIIRQTFSGKRIQVLSPGRINHSAGPDFLEIAIMLDGAIVVGDAEFHRNSNEWEQHNHGNDPRYDNVILHIVINHNSIHSNNFEILQISEDILQSEAKELRKQKSEITTADSLDDLQHFALLRILRKTGEAKKLLNELGVIPALSELTKSYIEKYHSGRKRPVYSDDKLINIAEAMPKSEAALLLNELNTLDSALIPDKMLNLIKKKIESEGAHLRREIVLNCVLPLALAVSEEQSRINLFLWYWSTPALHSYGLLKRKFPNFPQNFLWQQQGMLEYIREYGTKKNLVKESMTNYGFGELLSFYHVGKTPFNDE